MNVFVMLIFFLMDGEPVAQARVTDSLTKCVAEAQSFMRDMSGDPLITNVQINCVHRGPFLKRQRI